MRIALAVTEFPSASQTFVLDHATGLMARGHEVELHALHVGRDPVRHDGITRFELLRRTRYAPGGGGTRLSRLLTLLLAERGALLRYPFRAVAVLRHGRGQRLERWRRSLSFWQVTPDLIHAHSGYNGERLLPLYDAGVLHAPLVVTFHGHDVNAYLRDKPAGWYAPLFERAAALVVCSGLMHARLLELGAPADKLHCIPNGVEVGAAPPSWQAPAGPPRLLAVGRLVGFKGFQHLIEAMRVPALAALRPSLEIVGEGPERATLAALAAATGLDIQLCGARPQAEVRRLMRESDLYLAPAIVDARGDTETQGVAVIEAMASGLPVIASAVGALPETLGETAAALLPPADPAAITQAIVTALTQAERTRAKAAAARARAEQHFSDRVWLDRLEALYRSLLQ